MKWLNIELSTLRSAEYVGSSPAERGTWLSVSSFCADQENGGRVQGGLTWKDRQWQQACGVTLREVRAASRLIVTDGEDVTVFAYPVERENEVRSKREAGRRGGSATTAIKQKAARNNGTQAQPKQSLASASLEKPSSDPTEGNRKGIGREEYIAPTPSPRRSNPLFDALVEFEQLPANFNSREGGRIGTALKAIRESTPDVTPEEIKRRGGRYVSDMGRKIKPTAMGLATNWSKYEAEAEPDGLPAILDWRADGR